MIYSLVMPFITLNLGTEMLYILQQRLQAQNIHSSKASRVLSDVTKTMLTDELLEALCKRQPIYSHKDTREIFDRLAHSSIMRLSKPSMDKLYDLMTMGLKYQLLQCRDACELFQLTLNHLHSILEMVEDPETVSVVKKVIETIKLISHGFTIADWKLIQEQMFDFFQDRHVKVSLFLSSGIQYQNGSYRLEQHEKMVLPYESACGTVTFFSSNGESCHSQVIEDHPNGHISIIADASHLNTNKRTCNYGFNMYQTQVPKKSVSGRQENTPPTNDAHSDIQEKSFESKLRNYQSTSSNNSLNNLISDKKQSKTSEEFSLLASIIGGANRDTKGKISNENIIHFSNLFGKDEEPLVSDTELEKMGMNTTHPTIESIRFSYSDGDRTSHITDLMKDFDISGNTSVQESVEDNDQDLLDLMDMV